MIDSWEKILDPNFVYAELIGQIGSERVVTITDVDFLETYNRKTNTKEKKLSLIFEDCKPLVLNKTNIKTMIRLFGSDNPSKCVGKKITLYVDNAKFAGKPTTGIRIREFKGYKCNMCGALIKPAAGRTIEELAEISKRNTGRVLCVSCMKKAKEEQNG